MNTDKAVDLHRGGESKLLLKSETQQLIDFALQTMSAGRC